MTATFPAPSLAAQITELLKSARKCVANQAELGALRRIDDALALLRPITPMKAADVGLVEVPDCPCGVYLAPEYRDEIATLERLAADTQGRDQ